MMKVNLSSNISTYYWKFCLPLFIFFGLMLSFYEFVNESEFEIDFQFLIGGFIFLFYVLYNSFRFKFVKGDNDFLYIKNFSKGIKIPLENLKEVTETSFTFRIITIEFKEETLFGKKISFIPYSKWFLFGSEHPVVSEIKNYLKIKEVDFTR